MPGSRGSLGGRAASWTGVPVSWQRGQEGVLPPNWPAPQMTKPLRENVKFKSLLGCFLPLPWCSAPRPSAAASLWMCPHPCSAPLSSRLSIILCPHCLPGFVSRACLIPRFRGREAPEPPAAEGSYLSEKAAHCHYPAHWAGPLPSSPSSASASLSDQGKSLSLGFPICTMGDCIGWSLKALSALFFCESKNLDIDIIGIRPKTLTCVPRRSCWDAGSSVCPNMAQKGISPGRLHLCSWGGERCLASLISSHL